jgi:hypothetical protein
MSQQNQPAPAQTSPGVGSFDPAKMAPGWARLVVGLLGALFALSALMMAPAALLAGAKPAFQLFGFEIVTLIGGLMAIWLARGRAPEGFGLAVLGIAGAAGAGAVLSYMSVTGKHDFLHPSGVLGKIPLWPWFLLRVGGSGVLVATAALAVMLRRPASLLVLTKGLIVLAPALVMAGYVALMVKNGRTPFGELKGIVAVAATTGALFAGVLVVAALAIGGHLVIRAFEMGRREQG